MSRFLTSAAKNFGFEQQTEHDERYQRAEEYVTSVGFSCYHN
jgi:long-chain alkane monooxygenase